MSSNYYITLAEFSVQNIKKLRISDTYSWHRVVYSMFDVNRDDRNSSSGILWSLAKQRSALVQPVYILSDRQVSKSVDSDIRYKTIELPAKIFESKKFNFSVVVNPVIRQEGKVKPVKGKDNIINWFKKLSERNGFSVQEDNLSLDKVYVDQFTDKNCKNMVVQKATLSGTLSVIDKELFRQAVTMGIGRSKTYGCGLLQVVPIIE